jgi:hypothetical protein
MSATRAGGTPIGKCEDGYDLGFGIVWEIEIRDRVRAIDEERVTGVSYEDVMRAAEGRLAS